MEPKDWLIIIQIAVSALTLAALLFRAGQFTSSVSDAISGVREDLAQHTAEENKRFDEIRTTARAQNDKLQELATTQATHGTRLTHLETAGTKR